MYHDIVNTDRVCQTLSQLSYPDHTFKALNTVNNQIFHVPKQIPDTFTFAQDCQVILSIAASIPSNVDTLG